MIVIDNDRILDMIRAEVEKHGYNELSRRIGIDVGWMWRFVNKPGKHEVGIHTINMIAEYFGVPGMSFLHEVETKKVTQSLH